MFLLSITLLLSGAVAKHSLVYGKPDPPPEIVNRDNFKNTTRVLRPLSDTYNRRPHTQDENKLRPGSYKITSPNYPNNYGNDANKEWIRLGDDGQELTITCTYIIEHHVTCFYDNLKINGKTYCSDKDYKEKKLTVKATKFYITFKSDKYDNKKGFTCTIEVPSSSKKCCGIPNKNHHMGGGGNAEHFEYPWQVAVTYNPKTNSQLYHNSVHRSGVLINSQYVLTAARKNHEAKLLMVFLSEHKVHTPDGEKSYLVTDVIKHPKFNKANPNNYDFALLKLEKPINFSKDKNVAPICLPSAGELYSDVNAISTGWGNMRSKKPGPKDYKPTLMETSVRTNSKCEGCGGFEPHSTMICGRITSDVSVAQDDLGSPLVTKNPQTKRYELIGIVSHTRGSWATGTIVYARVTEALDWIKNHAKANLC